MFSLSHSLASFLCVVCASDDKTRLALKKIHAQKNTRRNNTDTTNASSVGRFRALLEDGIARWILFFFFFFFFSSSRRNDFVFVFCTAAEDDEERIDDAKKRRRRTKRRRRRNKNEENGNVLFVQTGENKRKDTQRSRALRVQTSRRGRHREEQETKGREFSQTRALVRSFLTFFYYFS